MGAPIKGVDAWLIEWVGGPYNGTCETLLRTGWPPAMWRLRGAGLLKGQGQCACSDLGTTLAGLSASQSLHDLELPRHVGRKMLGVRQCLAVGVSGGVEVMWRWFVLRPLQLLTLVDSNLGNGRYRSTTRCTYAPG